MGVGEEREKGEGGLRFDRARGVNEDGKGRGWRLEQGGRASRRGGEGGWRFNEGEEVEWGRRGGEQGVDGDGGVDWEGKGGEGGVSGDGGWGGKGEGLSVMVAIVVGTMVVAWVIEGTREKVGEKTNMGMEKEGSNKKK